MQGWTGANIWPWTNPSQSSPVFLLGLGPYNGINKLRNKKGHKQIIMDIIECTANTVNRLNIVFVSHRNALDSNALILS